jgi:hypothetical protein
MEGDEHVEVNFDASGMAVGSLGVPIDVAAIVLYRSDTATIEDSAASGTVTVTRYDGSGFAGTFSLTLSGGESITESFDVVRHGLVRALTVNRPVGRG